MEQSLKNEFKNMEQVDVCRSKWWGYLNWLVIGGGQNTRKINKNHKGRIKKGTVYLGLLGGGLFR